MLVEPPPARPLAYLRIDAVEFSAVPQAVQRLIAGVTVIAGQPNSGKSAMALDLALAVAAGTPWFDRKVRGGPVLYVAAEASGSILLRARATVRLKYGGRAPPLYVSSEVPALGSEAESAAAVDCIIAAMGEIASIEGEPVAMVIFDTAAAVLAGSDENGSGMTLLARAAHRIHAETGAAIVLLHHPGKSSGNALRGHSSLEGAADVIVQVEVDSQTKVRTARVTKARDFATCESISFELEAVTLEDFDAFGDPVTTVLLRPTDQMSASCTKAKAAGKNQERALAALAEWGRTNEGRHITTDSLKDLLASQGIKDRRRRIDCIEFLTREGVLTASVGGHQINVEAL